MKRWNNGGSSRAGNRLLAQLLNAPARRPEVRTPVYIPWVQADAVPARWLCWTGDPFNPVADHVHYSGPVAVLTSACTGSAAEDFLVSYLDSGRGPTVGEPTAGSTGRPNWFPLPGGGVLLICTLRECFPDGTGLLAAAYSRRFLVLLPLPTCSTDGMLCWKKPCTISVGDELIIASLACSRRHCATSRTSPHALHFDDGQ